MKKRTSVWLTVAAGLVGLGCILFVGVMTSLKWDYMRLGTIKYETNSYDITDAFDGVSITTDTADILFVPSGSESGRVVCYEKADAKHSVSVKNGTLTVELNEETSVYGLVKRIGLNSGSPKITVYLPNSEYRSLVINEATGTVEVPADFKFASADISTTTGDIDFRACAADAVSIKTTTGRVSVSGVACTGDISVSVSTGRVELTDLSCKSVVSSGTTGRITLDNVIASDKISVDRSTGDVRLDDSDAAEISIKTSTGDVKGKLLTDKVFITETGTGHVDVPKTSTGGRCEVTTNTGDIEMKID